MTDEFSLLNKRLGFDTKEHAEKRERRDEKRHAHLTAALHHCGNYPRTLWLITIQSELHRL